MTEFKGYVERKATIKFEPKYEIESSCLFKDVIIRYEVTGWGREYYEELAEDYYEWQVDINSNDIEPNMTKETGIEMVDWSFAENTKHQQEFADYMNELERLGSFEVVALGDITEEPTWEAVCEDEPIIVEGRIM